MDLVDLKEVRVTDLGVGVHKQSIDDGGEGREAVLEEHHIGSLSASLETLTLSKEFGERGHVGPSYTLQRVADCDGLPLSHAVESRTYKYVFEDAMAISHAGGRHNARVALHLMESVEFNGAREPATKRAHGGIRQAWSVDHLDEKMRDHNNEVLTRASLVLLQNPDLHCEVHGKTSTPDRCDPDLASYFGFDAVGELKRTMDRLAYERANAVVEALVARGVPRQQLMATYEGCAGQQCVVFIPRDSFHRAQGGQQPKHESVGKVVQAVFKRYNADRTGDLDLVELRTALLALGLPVDLPKVAHAIAKFQMADGLPIERASGRLDLDQFARLVEACKQAAASSTKPAPPPSTAGTKPASAAKPPSPERRRAPPPSTKPAPPSTTAGTKPPPPRKPPPGKKP